jgi:hypothetical protein
MRQAWLRRCSFRLAIPGDLGEPLSVPDQDLVMRCVEEVPAAEFGQRVGQRLAGRPDHLGQQRGPEWGRAHLTGPDSGGGRAVGVRPYRSGGQ